MYFVKVDPSKPGMLVDLGAFGFAAGDSVFIDLVGDFSASSDLTSHAGRDIHQNSTFLYGGVDYQLRAGGLVFRLSEQAGTTIEVVNHDVLVNTDRQPGDVNSDPDNDYGITLQPGGSARLALSGTSGVLELIEGKPGPEFSFALMDGPADAEIVVTAEISPARFEADFRVVEARIPAGATSFSMAMLTALTDNDPEHIESGTVTLRATMGGLPVSIDGVGARVLPVEVWDSLRSGLIPAKLARDAALWSKAMKGWFDSVHILLTSATPVSAVRPWIARLGVFVGVQIDYKELEIAYEAARKEADELKDQQARLDAQYNALRLLVVEGMMKAAATVGGLAAGALALAVFGLNSVTVAGALAVVASGWAAVLALEYFQIEVRDYLREQFNRFYPREHYVEIEKERERQEAEGQEIPLALELATDPDTLVALVEAGRFVAALPWAAGVRGTAETLHETKISGLGDGATILVEGVRFGREAVALREGSLILDIDTDGDGTADTVLTLTGDYAGHDVVVSEHEDGTAISLRGPVPDGLDAALSIAATEAAMAEGDEGATVFSFTVMRSDGLDIAASVAWTVEGTGLRPADAGDFVGGALPSGRLVLPAGLAARTIEVLVAGDSAVETHESFRLVLSDPSPGMRIGADAQATILADDAIVDLLALDGVTGAPVPLVPGFYQGPVAGIDKESVNETARSLTIAATGPNWFIRTGAGMDAIAAHGGRNVLDGGTGSNFLSGAGGYDTFFLDNRSPADTLWSTIVGFGVGDDATVWGVSEGVGTLSWFAAMGAPGFSGLTLWARTPGQPDALLTFAGFERADLDSGRLLALYGRIGEQTPYLYVASMA